MPTSGIIQETWLKSQRAMPAGTLEPGQGGQPVSKRSKDNAKAQRCKGRKD